MKAEVDPLASRVPDTRVAPLWARAAWGLLSGCVALSIGSAAATFLSATTPVDAVGSSFIDRTPAWLKDLAIAWFGQDSKTALRIGMFTVLALVATGLGIASRRSQSPLTIGIVGLGVLGAASIAEQPGPVLRGIGALAFGAVCAVVAARVLWGILVRHRRSSDTPSPSRAPQGWDRRAFLLTASAIAATSAAATGLTLRKERDETARILAQRPTTLPDVDPANKAIAVPATLHEDIDFITPTTEFYRIDTAFSFPRVDLDRWSLRIHGLVERELNLTYGDLLDRPHFERTITLCCVSNEVGGPYIGNAVWQGVLLSDLLREAGVSPRAEQVFSTSSDGWTCGFPVETALDGREALIAIGMNGEPLPLRHGFPARLVVPGLYGYVSATKWLSEIELNRWSDARGYWLPRGWARLAPVKTQSRIDVPRRGERIEPGPSRIAGVAWAQHVGIERVEVCIDRGPWLEAKLSDDVSDDTWRMWTLDWNAQPGDHTIQVRATDKSGATQTDVVSPVAPDGATGWHTRRVTVRNG